MLSGCIPTQEIPDEPPPGRAELVAAFGDVAAGTARITERDTRGDACSFDSLNVVAHNTFCRGTCVTASVPGTEREIEIDFTDPELFGAAAPGDTLSIQVRTVGCASGRGTPSDGWGPFYVTDTAGSQMAGVFTADATPLCGPTGCGFNGRFLRVLGGTRFDTTATIPSQL